MRRALRLIEARILPRGWRDALRQILLGVAAYMLYQAVRAIADGGSTYKPFGDATRIINLERVLHVFVEPSVQAWTASVRWLMDFADWTYLNAHYLVTIAALVFIYLRRNDSFYFVRNVFIIAMAIALVGYTLYPTAPPRLMPEWGFTDSISRFLLGGAGHIDYGPAKAFANLFAAVPSIHVCFAILIGWPMSRLTRRRAAKIAWRLYPAWISFVVVATGNHYLTDVVLGALTAAAAWFLAERIARARPEAWAFGEAAA